MDEMCPYCLPSHSQQQWNPLKWEPTDFACHTCNTDQNQHPVYHHHCLVASDLPKSGNHHHHNIPSHMQPFSLVIELLGTRVHRVSHAQYLTMLRYCSAFASHWGHSTKYCYLSWDKWYRPLKYWFQIKLSHWYPQECLVQCLEVWAHSCILVCATRQGGFQHRRGNMCAETVMEEVVRQAVRHWCYGSWDRNIRICSHHIKTDPT